MLARRRAPAPVENEDVRRGGALPQAACLVLVAPPQRRGRACGRRQGCSRCQPDSAPVSGMLPWAGRFAGPNATRGDWKASGVPRGGSIPTTTDLPAAEWPTRSCGEASFGRLAPEWCTRPAKGTHAKEWHSVASAEATLMRLQGKAVHAAAQTVRLSEHKPRSRLSDGYRESRAPTRGLSPAPQPRYRALHPRTLDPNPNIRSFKGPPAGSPPSPHPVPARHR